MQREDVEAELDSSDLVSPQPAPSPDSPEHNADDPSEDLETSVERTKTYRWLKTGLGFNRRQSVLVPLAGLADASLVSGTLGLLAQQQNGAGKRGAAKQSKQRIQNYAMFLDEMSSYFQEASGAALLGAPYVLRHSCMRVMSYACTHAHDACRLSGPI